MADLVITGGNVGIGQAPTAKLQVKQSSDGAGGGVQVVRSAAATAADFFVGSDNFLYLRLSASAFLTLDSSGNLGVGIATPTARLYVVGDNARAFSMEKSTVGVVAPGANVGMLRWEAGTNPGTLKLVAYAGTSTTGVTIVDNVGTGS